MKASKANTDIEFDVKFRVGDRELDEYFLPGRQSSDPNVIECFVPVEPGDTPISIYGRLSGSILVGALDLVVDGEFAKSSRIEPKKAQESVTYYNKRVVNCHKALSNEPSEEGTSTGQLDVYEGKLEVKALEDDDLKDSLHKPHPQSNAYGLGTVALVLSLSQSQVGRYSHKYESCKFGCWKEGEERHVLDSGIAPDHKLELVKKSTKVSQKQSVKFRNHYKEERVGFKPFCKVLFHYRSLEAIIDAGCKLRPSTDYHDLESGDPTNFGTAHGSPGVVGTPVDGYIAAMTPSDDADSTLMPSPPPTDTNQQLHVQSQTVMNSKEQSQEPAERKTLGGLLQINTSDKGMTSIAKEYNKNQEALRQSKSASPFMTDMKDYNREMDECGSAQETAAEEGLFLDPKEYEEAKRKKLEEELFNEEGQEQPTNELSDTVGDQDNQLEQGGMDEDENVEGGTDPTDDNTSWDFAVLDPVAPPQLEETTTDDRIEAPMEDRPAPESEAQDPSSTADLDRIPSCEAIRAAATNSKEGLAQESLFDIYNNAGPYEKDESLEEFGRRVNEVMTLGATGMYYLKDDIPSTQAQDSAPPIHPLDNSSSTAPQGYLIPAQHSDTPLQDYDMPPPVPNMAESEGRDEEQTSRAIKEEEVDPTSYAPPHAHPAPVLRAATPATTGTSATKKSKKRKAEMVAEDSPAKLRKIQAEQKLANTKLQLEQLKKATEANKKAMEADELRRADEKRRKAEEKRQRKEEKRKQKEREAREAEEREEAEARQHEADLAAVQKELALVQQEADALARKEKQVEIEESSDEDSSDDESDDGLPVPKAEHDE